MWTAVHSPTYLCVIFRKPKRCGQPPTPQLIDVSFLGSQKGVDSRPLLQLLMGQKGGQLSTPPTIDGSFLGTFQEKRCGQLSTPQLIDVSFLGSQKGMDSRPLLQLLMEVNSVFW